MAEHDARAARAAEARSGGSQASQAITASFAADMAVGLPQVESAGYTPAENLMAAESDAFNQVVLQGHYSPPPAQLGPVAALDAQRQRIAAQRAGNLEALEDREPPIYDEVEEPSIEEHEAMLEYIDGDPDADVEAANEQAEAEYNAEQAQLRAQAEAEGDDV
jgi:hypothetical protein